jgi:tetratricopeptide (TPR) repeat protein
VQTAEVNRARPPALLKGSLTEAALGYQRALEENPHNPQALMGMSLVALASRQWDAAVDMARAAVSEAGGSCIAWVALGQALKAANRIEEARQAYAQAIRRDGANALARVGMGELGLAGGEADAAVPEFELAIRCQPALVSAHMGLGHALASTGRLEAALACYGHALDLQPRLAEAEFSAGFVLAKMGKSDEAERRYRRALSLRPDFAAAWVNLGSVLLDQGREPAAEAALQRAAALRPDMITGWLNLARLERERSRMPQAEAYLHKALDADSSNEEVHLAWCHLCIAQKNYARAWQWLERAAAADPQCAEAANMRGILLHNGGRFEEAVESFLQAEKLGSQAAASNRGNSLLDLGRDREALRAHELAHERDPRDPGALYNLALARLRLGDWERGWPDYEARWRFRDVHRHPRQFRQPRWQGEPLENRRILLHAEQGLGDTIQFSRYASMVAERVEGHGGSVVLQVQEPAVRLMRSLSAAAAGTVEIVSLGAVTPELDLECPLMSLPAVFATTITSVPWPGAYLHADPLLGDRRLQEFMNLGPGMRIGIAWSGNPLYKADRERSTNLDTFLPLLRQQGAHWISLQKGEAAAQIAGLPSGVMVHDGSSRDADLAETAALMAALDLVITTDTCIAHLAGAMAKPVWILLPHLADWRWMQETETTPWYPTARLFRQRERGGWSELVERVADNLDACAAAVRESLLTRSPA